MWRMVPLLVVALFCLGGIAVMEEDELEFTSDFSLNIVFNDTNRSNFKLTKF